MTNRRLIPFAGICTAFLITAVAFGSHDVMASDPAGQQPVYAVSAEDIGPLDGSPPQEKPSRKSHRTDWGRDPFQHPLEKVTPPHGRIFNGTRLVGIIGGKKGRVAIFGHSVLQKGDMVGNEMIVDIDRNRVTVARNGSRRIIAMQEMR